jgi:hypothetical protein
VVRLLLLAASLGVALASAAEPAKPDDARLRQTVTKGLEFLEREADTWMNEKTCNGCHHMPALLWSHREAQRRGFAIDPKQFAEFVDWSSMHSKEIGAGREMVAFLKLAMPEKPMPELTSLIVKGQRADGSWSPAGQLADMQRRGNSDAKTNSARIFLLALGSDPADQAACDAARLKAADLLAKSEPATCLDSIMYRALDAERFGPPEDVAANREEIVHLQHADGGWSYVVGEEQSDPLATGEALYLLQRWPGDGSAAAVERGQAWLMNHQRDDGGWSIDITRISKIDRSPPAKAKSFKDATMIYTFWGSAWATLGLVQHFPILPPEKAAEPSD